MESKCQDQLAKLVVRIEAFIALVNESNTLTIHAHIDPYFYVQKVEELKVLVERIRETNNRLDTLKKNLRTSHEVVFNKWKSDVRWLHRMRPAARRFYSE